MPLGCVEIQLQNLPTLTLSLSGMVTLVETASGLGKTKSKLKKKERKMLILNSFNFGIKWLGKGPMIIPFVL